MYDSWNATSGPIRWHTSNGSSAAARRWTWLDAAAIILLTAISALMTFIDLGNRQAPQTFWKPDRIGQTFTVDFGLPQTVDRLTMYEGPGAQGKTRVESSLDGQTWETYAEIEHSTGRVFTWKTDDKTVSARYMKFTTVNTGYRIYEAAFYAKADTSAPIPIDSITPDEKGGSAAEGSGALVFDEQQWAPYRPDYRNSMYFDEIYHGRTAYEFVEVMQPYENTHPPLGKIILSLGVRMFDMTPYGWRFMAGVMGTLMVPIFYAALRGMFGRTRYAVLGTALLVLEGFHLVHSRSANVDISGVTFTIVMFAAMYKYGETRWLGGGFSRSIRWLALGGVFFGAAAAVKWNYLYGGAGLAILFFIALYRRWREARLDGRPGYLKRLVLTLLAALLLFVAVPATIYTASFGPFIKGTAADDSYRDVWQFQKNMYHYHVGVTEQHPYGSRWYTWPLMLRPVYYYGGDDLPDNLKQSIAAMGNPLIWYGGLLALLASVWYGIRRRDTIVLTMVVAYLSFYVPWMVSPRSVTFLYHYFPMVPLLITSFVWMLRWIEEHNRNGYKWTRLVMFAALALFIWFYPVYTGMTIDKDWMDIAIRWLPSWDF